MTNNRYSREAVEKAVAESSSLAQAMVKIGTKPRGSSYGTLWKKIEEYKVDVSHFTGQSHNKGKPSPRRKSSEYYLGVSHKRVARKYLALALEENGIPYACSKCGLGDEWEKEKIVLQVDHIDGNGCNNKLDNLRYLCPNCHSQTETWGYKGTGLKKQNECPDCGKSILLGSKRCQKCSPAYTASKAAAVRKTKKTNHCGKCKKPIQLRSRYCEKCSYEKSEKIVWPDRETLENMIRSSNFLQVGKMLGVSDNAVRKRLKKYEIES